MKLSLLEITQTILSEMESDEINSISDTTEARQVASIVRTAYFNILTRANLPEQNKLFNLLASTEGDQPVLMHRPENIARIDWIKYNTSDDADADMNYVTILPIEQFLDMTNRFDLNESTVSTFTLNSNTFNYQSDRGPTYATIFDDYYVVFDSYNSTVDSTLQTSKNLCKGQVIPTFSMTDGFIPEMDELQFPLLINEAKSLAFLTMKQIAHEQAVQESRKQWRSLQKNKNLVTPNYFDQLPNFGRK